MWLSHHSSVARNGWKVLREMDLVIVCPSFESGSRPLLPTKSWASWAATPEALRPSNSSRDLEFAVPSPAASCETVWVERFDKNIQTISNIFDERLQLVPLDQSWPNQLEDSDGSHLHHSTIIGLIRCKNVGDNVLDLLGSYSHYTVQNPSSLGVRSSLLITVLDFYRWWPCFPAVSKGYPPNAASCMHQNQ